ncbi:MAG: biopolymer transporter ExbD [Archangiaceae bacterium]|nr:biopolymer transporter ExbD [Archangiaceae bacterium]
MGIQVPGKRMGKRLQHSKVFGHAHAKKSGFADLLVTPLVDMFVIIVLFLIANFSATGEVLMMSKDISLPEAKNVQDIQSAPVVTVSKTEVLLSGSLIGRVEDFTREEYLNIPLLEEKLRDEKKKFEDLHSAANDSGAFKGDVNIQADKQVEFRIIKRVMFSCASAGFGNINFATLNVGGGPNDAPPKKDESASR